MKEELPRFNEAIVLLNEEFNHVAYFNESENLKSLCLEINLIMG